MEKRKVTVDIDDVLWRKFLARVLKKHGRAAGGAISEEVANAVRAQLKK